MPVRELGRFVGNLRRELADGADDDCADCVSCICAPGGLDDARIRLTTIFFKSVDSRLFNRLYSSFNSKN